MIKEQVSSNTERLGLVKTDNLHIALHDLLDYINQLPSKRDLSYTDALKTIKHIDADILELSRIVRHLENLASSIDR